jgi:3-oxoadipate enol-lactonase
MPVAIIDGLRHYYRLEGNPAGHRVVLLHAVGTDLSLWDRVLPLLTRTCHVLRCDLRGHGGTDVPSSDCTVEALGSDVLALTQKVGWDRFVLTGLSLGALTAMQIALVAPERVAALVLISTATPMQAPPGGWEARARLALQQGMGPLAAPMVEKMFSQEWRATNDAMLHTMRTVFALTEPRGYASCLPVLASANFSARLHEIACPTLIVRGSADHVLDQGAAKALADGIKGARLVDLNTAHFPPIEDPGGFASEMGSLLRATFGELATLTPFSMNKGL